MKNVAAVCLLASVISVATRAVAPTIKSLINSLCFRDGRLLFLRYIELSSYAVFCRLANTAPCTLIALAHFQRQSMEKPDLQITSFARKPNEAVQKILAFAAY